MKPELAFFSFAEITDNSKHYEFNEYHQLDHRPENLALPGVLFGERWVRTPELATLVPTPTNAFSGLHYMTMYWLRGPVDKSRVEWQEFGTTAAHLGRRPDLDWSTRPLVAPFVPLKGYVNERILISAEALPFRPAYGVYVTVSDCGNDPVAGERVGRWYDRVHVPELLRCDGVAGAWTFVSETAYPGRRVGEGVSPGLRIHVYFVDRDPAAVWEGVRDKEDLWGDDGSPIRDNGDHLVFRALLRTIVPWEWGWFADA